MNLKGCNIFCDGHTDVNSNDDDDAVFPCDDVACDVISPKNVDSSFSSDTNNDASNAVTPPDYVTPISSSRASKDIVHPSHKTNNMDPSPSKSVSIETSNGEKKETIIFLRLEKWRIPSS